MKRLTITLTLIFVACLNVGTFSQTIPDPFASAFSSAASDAIQFDFDVPDTLADATTFLHEVIYRDQTVNSWSIVELAESYAACSIYSYSAIADYVTSSDQLEWYNRSEIDTIVITQSPKNAGNTFPAPSHLLADLGADPTGDQTGTSSSYLDITHCYASYSDTKLYVTLQNNGGGFPTNSGFNFFVYSVGIIDPDATDSVGYAMVYANVPLLVSPGLYMIDPVDSSFSQIGNISTNISGNSLSMSCNISNLTSQPGWSDWPPPSNVIVLAPVTATQGLSGSATNDFGKIAIFQPYSHVMDISTNNAPTLSDATVTVGEEGAVSASIVFTDSDNNCAAIRDLYIDAEIIPMTACEKDYVSGTLFEAELTVPLSGWYEYHFEFSDGLQLLITDPDSVYVDLQTYVPGDADGSGEVDIDDVVFLIHYIFSGGTAPDPLEAGDPDCSGAIDIDDVVYLISYIFTSGPAPCAL